jgi:hypothetical protein
MKIAAIKQDPVRVGYRFLLILKVETDQGEAGQQ